MRLTSSNFTEGERIPGQCAFAVPNSETHIELSENRNPHLSWEDVPDGVGSFAVLCVDPDAPSVGDDVNQEGKIVPADLARTDFVHWVLIDIPSDTRSIDEGELSTGGVVAHGKPGRSGRPREGLNDFTSWFSGDPDMEGTYMGYDGPCPPWNDALPHRYVFTVYALDLDECPVSGDFTAADVRTAIEGHVLAEASLTGVYSLNPEVDRPQPA